MFRRIRGAAVTLVIVKTEPRLVRVVLIVATIACLVAAWFFIKWNFANAVASRLDPNRPESKIVADWLTQVATGDPQTHFAAAVLYEKTFDTDDLIRSLLEYETAAALSPYHYVMWLNLGKARSLSGDTEGSLSAFRRALELAPNYSIVQWVYGNSLIRQGQTDKGFALIAKAAASNPEYARTAVLTALEMYEGDVATARRALGESEVTHSALASVLAGQKRYAESVDAWSNLANEDKRGNHKTLGDSLTTQLVTAKKILLAARVVADMQDNDANKPSAGAIVNGGFENGVKLRNAGVFEWQIADGIQPQIGLGEGQAHGGKYSLWMIFNTSESTAFRSVSQTVPVVPGGIYEFEVFYRSDLKTAATFRWEVADASAGTTLSATAPLAPAADWTSLRGKFTAPAGSDGVVVRLAREGCGGPLCPVNGKLSFDDISIRRL